MAAPALAAAAAKKAAVEAAKDPAGAAKKGAQLGCAALVVVIAVPIFIFCTLVSIFVPVLKIFVGSSPPAQSTSTANLVQPMPTLASGLANPTEKAIIVAAQTAVLGAGDPRIGTSYSNARIQLLLAMAWVDSQWGTSQGSSPILSGSPGMVAAQAAVEAGLSPDGTNFVDAIAISDAESSWVPNVGACNAGPGAGSDFDYVAGQANTGFEDCTSIGVGLWQDQVGTEWCGCSTNTRDGFTRDQLTDPLTNAKVMMSISSNGTNWGPWCTAWSGGSCSEGTLLGCPGSKYCAFIPAAQAIQQQVSNVGLGGSYTGIILAVKTEWQTLIGSADPNATSSANAVFNAVNQKLGPTSGSDPTQWQPQLVAWYSLSIANPSTAAITAHVQLIIQVDQMGYGGTTGLNQAVLAEAKSQIGNPCTDFAPDNWCPQTSDQSEWCAYFVSWVFQKAGVPNMPTESLAASMQTWAQGASTFTQTPEPGDAAVWANTSGIQHTDIVAAVQGSGSSLQVETIDGNAVPDTRVQPPTGWYSPLQADSPDWYAVGYAVP